MYSTERFTLTSFIKYPGCIFMFYNIELKNYCFMEICVLHTYMRYLLGYTNSPQPLDVNDLTMHYMHIVLRPPEFKQLFTPLLASVSKLFGKLLHLKPHSNFAVAITNSLTQYCNRSCGYKCRIYGSCFQ